MYLGKIMALVILLGLITKHCDGNARGETGVQYILCVKIEKNDIAVNVYLPALNCSLMPQTKAMQKNSKSV
jgi:hypothetical protein